MCQQSLITLFTWDFYSEYQLKWLCIDSSLPMLLPAESQGTLQVSCRVVYTLNINPSQQVHSWPLWSHHYVSFQGLPQMESLNNIHFLTDLEDRSQIKNSAGFVSSQGLPGLQLSISLLCLHIIISLCVRGVFIHIF